MPSSSVAMDRYSTGLIALLPIGCLLVGTVPMQPLSDHAGALAPGRMSVGALAAFVSIALFIAREVHVLAHHMHASVLIGIATAWATLPHSVLDFRDVDRSPTATEIPGCQVMALAGCPIQQVSAHGGGGWRLGCHLTSDVLAHAGNCAVWTLVAWLVLGLVPTRRMTRVHWAVWLAFPLVCFYGWAGMLSWWD